MIINPKAGDTVSHPKHGEWILPCGVSNFMLHLPPWSRASGVVDSGDCEVVRVASDAETIAALRYTAGTTIEGRLRSPSHMVRLAREQLTKITGPGLGDAPTREAVLLMIADCGTTAALRRCAADVFSGWFGEDSIVAVDVAYKSRMMELVVAEAEFGGGS